MLKEKLIGLLSKKLGVTASGYGVIITIAVLAAPLTPGLALGLGICAAFLGVVHAVVQGDIDKKEAEAAESRSSFKITKGRFIPAGPVVDPKTGRVEEKK